MANLVAALNTKNVCCRALARKSSISVREGHAALDSFSEESSKWRESQRKRSSG